MRLKKVAVALALCVLLAAPCAAGPLTDTVVGFLDSILKLPLTLAGLSHEQASEEQVSQEEPVSPTLLVPDSTGDLTQTDGLNPDDPTTEDRGKIDPAG
jgi:hypothetical protein